MTITINRKRINSIELFPDIDDFILYLKENYNKINFESDKIKSSISSIYSKIINDDGNILYLRFNRWLPSKFGFTPASSYKLIYWIERGFTEDDYKKYTSDIFRENGDRLKSINDDNKRKSSIYDSLYSDKFKYKSNIYENVGVPKCSLCNCDLIIKKSSSKKGDKFYLIETCSNVRCLVKDNKNVEVFWKAFLPKDLYDKMISNKYKSIDTCLTKEFWIKRGLCEEDAIKKISELQSRNSKKFKGKRSGKNKNNLREKGYTEEQIRLACLSELNIEYWINMGFTEEEAIYKISEKQRHAAGFVDYNNRLLPSNVEYWLKRGYSDEEALLEVKKSQTTFSKEICIKKHGYDNGIEIFNERTRKWLNSLLKNGNLTIGYSKISQILFDSLKNFLNDDFLYATNGGEFKIKRDDGGYYVYDFVCLKKNKIIEYNGDMYHANPSKYKFDDNPHPFRKYLTANMIWEKDFNKIETAKNEGFDILVIWDSEFRYKGKENRKKIIEKCISFLNS